MKVTTYAEQRKAKIRFAFMYIISLVLVFVVMSAFWKKLYSGKSEAAPATASEKETYFMQLDTALHARLEGLDAVSKKYLQARQSGTEADVNSLSSARNAFRNALDSIDRQAGFLNEGPKKSAMDYVSAKFRTELESREAMLNSVVALPKIANPASVTTPAVNNELEALKRKLQEKDATIATLQNEASVAATAQKSSTGNDTQLKAALAEKDKLIASLQTQLKQKDAALQTASSVLRSIPSAGGGEWQQKYLSLKSSFDKVSASEKSLKSAYQTLADDNRRLLGQLQSARKG